MTIMTTIITISKYRKFIITMLLSLSAMLNVNNAIADTIPNILETSAYKNYQQLYQSFFDTRDEKNDSEENEAKWRAAVENNPQDLLLRTYWASSISLIGRDSWMPWNKIKYVEEAIKVFDDIDGQLADPQAQTKWQNKVGFYTNALFDIWMIEAQTLLALPNNIFKTHVRAKGIIKNMMQHPKYAKADAEFRKDVEKLLKESQEE